MPVHRAVRRALAVLLAALALSMPWTAVVATPAQAHAKFAESAPVDNEVVATQPDLVRMRFTEAVTIVDESLILLDATGAVVETDAVYHHEGKTNTAAVDLPPGLAEGTYVVSWRISSADSHIVAGAFRFSIGEPSPVVIDVSARSLDLTVELAQGTARALAFGGFALLVGGGAFILFLWPQGRADRTARRLVSGGLVVLLAGTVGGFLLQGVAASGKPLSAILSPDAMRLTWDSRLGPALAVRVILALAAAVWLGWLARRPRPGPVAAAVGLLLAAGLAGTWTWADHAHSGIQQPVAIPVASAHLVAMALWLGGLAVLVVAAFAPRPGLDGALERFSRLATVCWGVLAASGVYLSWRQVDTPPAVWRTQFGLLLLAKLAVVLVVLALAARVRAAVRRRTAGRVRRSVATELALGVVILGITSAIVGTTPARDDYAPPVDVRHPLPAEVAQHFGAATGEVLLHVEPALQGSNVVDIYLEGPGGRLLRVEELSGRLSLDGKSLVPVDISEAEPGHYVATAVSVPAPGRWDLRLDLRVNDFDEYPVVMSLDVR